MLNNNFFLSSGLTLEVTSELVKQRIQQQILPKFNKLFLYSTVEYLSQTLMQHYHLLMFAFNRPRDVENHCCRLHVEVSPYEVLGLAESKQIDRWKMENDLMAEEEIFQAEETVFHSFILLIRSFILTFIFLTSFKFFI